MCNYVETTQKKTNDHKSLDKIIPLKISANETDLEDSNSVSINDLAIKTKTADGIVAIATIII